jgi:hypothetical protein
MDQIRKALDKARLERAGARSGGVGQPAADIVADPQRGIAGARAGSGSVPASGGATGDLESALSVPFSLDPQVLEANRLLLPDAPGPAGSAMRLLRTQVLKRMRENGWRTLGITSARSGEGKSTLAANLAIAIATDPRHTALVVDFDLRRPSLARLFGHSPAVGVDDVLSGEARIDVAFTHPDSIGSLRVLAARGPVQSSSNVVAGAACQALVGEIRDRYVNRIVLFDMPPVLEADDAVTLSGLFDCLLFVVAEGHTAREDVARALSLVKDVPVVGTVLNRSVEAIHSEAYG